MQTVNIRNKFNLYSAKVIVLVGLLFSTAAQSQSFLFARKNNPNYDEKRKISYGFLIGLHTTTYQIKHSEKFLSNTAPYDTMYAVETNWKPGFSLGFLVNYRINDMLDARITPTVSFYEHSVNYLSITGASEEQLVETTMVEFPMLLKFKSMRRGNIRMYMVGGVRPGIEASGKKEVENTQTQLEVSNFNMSLDAGIGFDLYFPLFKFSPEIRFSRGISDVLDNKTNRYGEPMQRINTNTISVLLIFQ